MILLSADGAREVRLAPVGYQFEPVTDPDVDTWLVIAGQVRDPRGDWEFEDPCLTVPEAEALGAWLRAVAAGQVSPSDVETQRATATLLFTEPNLSLSAAPAPDNQVAVRVHFDYESRPPWASEDRAATDWVEVVITPEELAIAADEFIAEIAPYSDRS